MRRPGDLLHDPATRVGRHGDRPVRLTAKEYQILHLFMSEPGKVFSRTEIIDRVYDDEFEGMSNVVDVFLSRLRRKLSRDGGAPVLRTVRGMGYSLGNGSA